MRRVRESFPFSVELSDIQQPRITLACVASRFESPSCNARKHLANALRISTFSLLIAWLSPISAWAQADNGATGEETPTTEVVVTAARTTLPANALPLTVDVIDSKSLAQQAALSGSVIDALSTLVPSFSPTRQKLSGSGESLRGRSPLYAINGIPQSTPLRDGSRDGFTIDPFFVDRVELIYGSNALQGIGGTGGIVNQVTVGAPRVDGLSGRFLMQGTAGDGSSDDGLGGKLAGLVSNRTERFDATVGAAYEQRGAFYDGDGRRIGVDNTQGEIQDSTSWSLFGRFGYQLDDSTRLDLIASRFELAGQTGSTVAGVLALIGIGFVATGTILWWPLRKTFRFRPWPARMSRPAIIRQHRDLGIVIAPLLFLSLLTGAMMNLRPVAMLLLSPWSSPSAMERASAKPDAKGGPLADRPDWASMLTQARRHFPTAEFRLLALPGKSGDLISLRMKQPEEWLPNGRTMLWFAPEDGRLVEARDALTLPTGLRINNSIYPLHAAKVGGLPYRLVMTASGLSLAMLGSLSVWAFWFRGKPLPHTHRYLPGLAS